jgi:multiple sugar transport system permease protein
MAAIAELSASRPHRRFLLDRTEMLGPLFIAPAIVYVFVLVALPFFLALYYSISAYTIFDPSYRFVGWRNFIDVVHSGVFRRTLINTFIFTIGAQIIGLLLGKFGAMLLMRNYTAAASPAP